MAHMETLDDGKSRLLTRRAAARGLGLSALVLLGGGAAWWGGRRGARLYSGARTMMGTRASIVIAHHDPEEAADIVARALDRMEAVASRLTRFDTNSEIGRVNAHPGTWVPIGESAHTVIRSALEVARASDGVFDPGLDRLTALWGFHGQEGRTGPPPGAALEAWRDGPGYRAIEIDEGHGQARLRLRDPRAGIDLGGIAKGYAIDEGVRVLRDEGVRHAMVEAGGDLFALGGQPDGQGWPVGVRHPRKPGALLTVLSVRDQGVATSGDYERFFERDGTRYAHLIDPRTARPAGELQSLTVRAETAMLADAWATAGFIAGPEARRRLLGRVSTAPWLAVDENGREENGRHRA